MNGKQIFISYARENKGFALKLYEDLLWDGYPVWMEKKKKEGEEWRPQIDHNLKSSDRFVVLISPDSIDSKWVKHEISMACGRDLKITPVKIQHYSPNPLPIGVDVLQLLIMVEGEVDYDRQLKILKHRLGPTIPIQEQLESMLISYITTGRLLTEVELKLIEKHEKTLVWPEGKDDLKRELIDKSKRALVKFWKRYNDLERDYVLAQREIARLNKEDEQKKRLFRFVLGYAFAFIGFLVIILLAYMAAYVLK